MKCILTGFNKKFKGVVAVLVCCSVVSVSGCASIISGGSQEVSFKSEPDGALITIGGREIGKTPFTTKLDRKADQVVTIKLDGYKTQEFPFATSVNGWFFGNILFGGLLGSSTDSATGAINQYSPDFYNITLVPLKTSSIIPQDEVRSFVIANYRSIIEELNSTSTQGQYVKSLWSLLKISPEKQQAALVELKKLSETNTDIVEFAKKVSAQLS